jgi:Tfp pilus assembly PilM family ATPase
MWRSKFWQKARIKVGISINNSRINFILIEEKARKIHILNQGEFITEDLLPILKKIKLIVKDNPCWLVLPHRDFIIKSLTLSSSMSEKEIEQFLALNANDYFSYPLDFINYDFEYVNNTTNQLRILAGKREYIRHWQEIFAKSSLMLAWLSVDILAIENYIRVQKLDVVNSYALFLCHHNEFLQMIIVNDTVLFSNIAYLKEFGSTIFEQEIAKFLRLYESSNLYRRPIDQLICLLPENVLQKMKVNLPITNFLKINKYPEIDFNYLLAFGLVLSC